MSRRFVGGAPIVLAVLASAACGGSDNETVTGGLGYSVEFPSKQAAIASESLKIYVFSADQDCLTLVQTRRGGGALPTALAETTAAPVCDYLSGKAGNDIVLAAGTYAVFAVAQRENQDFLLGCAEQAVNATTAPEPVALSLADETRGVPATTCTLLSQKCGGGC